MRRMELYAVALAFAAHAVFLGAARRLPERRVLRHSPKIEPVEVIVVEGGSIASTKAAGASIRQDVPTGPTPPAPETERTGQEPPSSESTEEPRVATSQREDAASDAIADARGTSPEASPGSAESTTGAPTTSPPPPNPSDEFSDPNAEPSYGVPSLAGLVPGLDVGNRIAIADSAPKAAPTEAPAALPVDKKKANEVLSSTVIGQDREKGIELPATGVVVGAVSDATRVLPVPHNTRASFEVKLGAGGKVVGVRVMSSSGGDAAAWAGAAKAVASSLGSKTLALGEASKTGATVIVSVTVKHVYPTGTAKGADVKPVCANQILNDIADAAEDKPSAPPDSVVPLFQDENGRPCIPIGVGGTADGANIGATKQIQIQTSTKVLIGGKEALPAVKPVNKDPFWAPSTKDGPRPVAPQKMRKYKRDREKKK